MGEKIKNISRLFIALHAFERAWKDASLTDDERRALEVALLEDPKTGSLVQGTHGVRKIRHAIAGKGKSGGIRIFYYDFESLGRIYLLALIKKGEQENLTKEQRNQLGEMIIAIKRR